MAACSQVAVWEWKHDSGMWRPYPSVACQLLERAQSKSLRSVQLGDADPNLASYVVIVASMEQSCQKTNARRPVRRILYPAQSPPGCGIMWQWGGDNPGDWHSYDIPAQTVIEAAYQKGISSVQLFSLFPYLPYTVDLHSMVQIRLSTQNVRPVRRVEGTPYPLVKGSASSDALIFRNGSNMPETLPMRTSARLRARKQKEMALNEERKERHCHTLPTCCSAKPLANGDSQKQSSKCPTIDGIHKENQRLNFSDLKNGLSREHVLMYFLAQSTDPKAPVPYPRRTKKPQPVPGVKPPSRISMIKIGNNVAAQTVMEHFTISCPPSPNEACCICYENLTSPSTYDGNISTVALNVCLHQFHKSCLKAMYDSGTQDESLQCPTCNKIYGIKCGNQPSGSMDYHIISDSLPGFPDCHTIRIIYNIPSGIQTSEHPHPGQHYTARGFPRHCYLPDNEKGRKVLKLLIRAWERRLLFTIGTSATTGENDTVTWNEIHHKTEFGSNRSGHGYPDPNYLDNVLEELAVKGITE